MPFPLVEHHKKKRLDKINHPSGRYPRLDVKRSYKNLRSFWRRHWIGTLVIVVATIVFFWPLLLHIGTYSEGGDAMFNSWAIARNQHCILRQDCANYANGNVFFPHKYTMLYSESEFSSGLITLPLYFIDQNPLLSNNVLTILSFFLSGWFMYLLAKYLSKGNELFSILAGLIFEFAPLRMPAVWHLQNLSILYLPLAVLLILKFFEHARKRYLVYLFIALFMVFYASWYQMVFVIFALASFVLGMLIFKAITWKQFATIALVIVLAAASTFPLAKQYLAFSKSSHATFTLNDQTTYASSLDDYIKPYSGTLLGEVYYKVRPHAKVNSYNPDSDSYHGMVLYIAAISACALAYRYRKRSPEHAKRFAIVASMALVGIVGFIVSLGPLLKIRSTYTYLGLGQGIPVTIPMPYILVDKFVPQLAFLRTIGRASVLLLFALCCLLAIVSIYIVRLRGRTKYIVIALVCIFVAIELMPAHRVVMSKNAYSYNLQIPQVYRYIKQHKEVNDIVILTADKDYPHAPFPVIVPEEMLWAGYTNRNIFNGYSSYQPPEYAATYADFVNFHPNDIAKMKKLGLRYVLVDRQLSTSNPNLANSISVALGHKEQYRDSRFSLFSLQ